MNRPASLVFADRVDAGRRLAEPVADLRLEDPVVLGLARGGVPVARVIADRLGVGVEVFVARKIAVPGFPEVGMAAIAEGSGDIVLGPQASELGFETGHLRSLADEERRELHRRAALYRGERALPEMAGRDVLLADDGVATGVTAQAALNALRRWRPRRLIFAAPVCARDAAERIADLADGTVWLAVPQDFGSVGTWYERFEQLEDADVIRLAGPARPGVGGRR
ncbi:phosphoribosyltransferase [Actinospica sp.]|uniref:phosphoribosyltransferase n=1 Tax=Actinospica sp. TaxID=1872142 RepID=UPI002B8C83DE|nr:phosphoribosyltransferase family protein [Actinospica sp.]HWG27222.1 phosphoribosyltransferase family protein [Actinospica sp.]